MKYLFVLLTLLSFSTFAQNNFQLIYSIKSLSGQHEHFQAKHKNKFVYNSFLLKHKFHKASFEQYLNVPLIIEKHDFELYKNAKTIKINQIDSGYVFLDKNYLSVLKKEVWINLDYPYLALFHNDTLIWMHPLYSKKDTLANVKVFYPNPIVSAYTNYGAPYADNNNQNNTELNFELFDQKTIIYDLENKKYLLENNNLKVNELSLPNHLPPTLNSNEFYFNRSDSAFEDVNAFYHLNRNIEYLKDTLGFENLMNYQLQIDAHALNNSDNSIFISANNPPEILFGDGGVDDAEDAQVIVHELMHAIVFSASPNTNIGMEREALEEGNADYFASSYTKKLMGNSWEKIPSWDGHNEFWNGRVCNSIKKYPNELTGNKYFDAEIWSSTLMEIENEIGKLTTDILLIESTFLYFPGMSMTHAGKFLLKTDTLLNNNANSETIQKHLCNRGILNPCGEIIPNYSIPVTLNYYDLMYNYLTFSDNVKQYHQMNLYQINGKQIMELNGEIPIKSSLGNLAKGIYFIELKNETKSEIIKIILY